MSFVRQEDGGQLVRGKRRRAPVTTHSRAGGAVLGALALLACHDGAPTPRNAMPTIDSIAPGFVLIQGGAQALTVYGTGFVPSSRARWRDADRNTVYLDGTRVSVQLLESDAASGGAAPLAIYNPPPGGGTSSVFSVTVGFPPPVLSSVNPTTVVAASGAVTVTLRGSGFVSESVVRLNGASQAPPIVISPNELQLVIPSATIAQPGVRSFTVVNPGRPPSAAVEFSVTYPVPVLSRIVPDSIALDFGSLITVFGSRFFPTSQVLLDGAARTTTFTDSTQLLATLTAADLGAFGAHTLTLVNPAPGGGPSSNRTLVVRPAVLRIVRALPSLLATGSAATSVAMTGFGFSTASVVRANGTVLPSVFAAPDTLRVTMPPVLLTAAGQIALTVSDPTSAVPSPPYAVSVVPGNPTFTERVVARLNNDMVYDPRRDRIYVSGNGQTAAEAQRLFAIDPNTGAVVWDVAVSHAPNQLAVSADGSHLFATLNDTIAVMRFDLDRQVEDGLIELRDETGTLFAPHPFGAFRIVAVPGMPDAFVVSTLSSRASLFQGGVCRSTMPGLLLALGAAAGEVLAWPGEGGVRRYRIIDGRFADDLRRASINPEAPGGPAIDSDGGVVVAAGGGVADAATLMRLGGAAAFGQPAVDGANLRIHFFLNLGVKSFHARSLEPTGAITLTLATGIETKMMHWGHNGLALRRATGIVLVSGSAIAP